MSSEPVAAWFGQVVTGMPAVSRTPSTTGRAGRAGTRRRAASRSLHDRHERFV